MHKIEVNYLILNRFYNNIFYTGYEKFYNTSNTDYVMYHS